MVTAIQTPAGELQTAARSRLYRLLADAFLYPTVAFFEELLAGRYRDEVARVCEPLGYDLEPALDGLVASGRHIDFQADYLRLFEVGLGVPPCPLYSGVYRGGRKAVMEELTRFYNYFGLSVERGRGELPDHISTELEFMHYLTYKELAALNRRQDPMPYRRAQADFLERQLGSWLPALEARLAGLNSPAFYTGLTWLANAVTQGELAALRQSPGPAPDLEQEDAP
jgi:DMSO reductase family type II enzyme chaperone